MVIWENCGNGHPSQEKKTEENSEATFSVGDNDSGLNSSPSSGDMSISDTISEANSPTVYKFTRSQYNDKYAGIALGWFVLCVTLGLTVTTTYYLYTEDHEALVEQIPYGLNIALSGLWIITACYTFILLTQLTFFDEELRESAANQKGVEYIKCQYSCEVKRRMDQRFQLPHYYHL